jgi:hypothetical protein
MEQAGSLQVPELRRAIRNIQQVLMEHAMSLDNGLPASRRAAAESFLGLLYRYLWPFAYFRDVTSGQRLQRQLNYRYNREMRVYLPGFAAKWALLTALCFGAGAGLGSLPVPVALVACVFATGVYALAVALIVLTAWCWLSRFPELY